VRQITLEADDLAALSGLVTELSGRYSSVEDTSFQNECRVYAEELPRGLRRAVGEFRLAESPAVLLISGLPVDDPTLGPTPAHWIGRQPTRSTLRYDLAFYLLACLLGEPVGWATQQDGRIMHDVFPIEEHAGEQIGWGSSEVLTWHTEDAFHPLRTDYLGLMCLRNPDRVETTFADIRDVELDSELRELLARPRYYILPDDSHRPQNQLAATTAPDARLDELRARSRERVERGLAEPEPVAVLFGSGHDPYLRIDPAYMEGALDRLGPAERAALDKIGAALDSAMRAVALTPGDICFIDNYQAVHGRQAFRARFDGTDRWLRRLNLTRDLRKSRAARLSARSRVIY
jgi:Fe(II)/alpha-ketoglutarate-dependent arginine beta-hydroxylase